MTFSTPFTACFFRRTLAVLAFMAGLALPHDVQGASPAIQVKDQSGIFLAHGDATSCGGVPVTCKKDLTFVIGNTGDADLTGLAVSISGANAGDFSVVRAPLSTTVAPGGTTPFTVTFRPQSGGTRSAVMSIASDDPGHPVFTVTLTGQGNLVLNPVFTSAFETAFVASGFNATGLSLGQLTLGFAPSAGTVLRVVSNSGGQQIIGNLSDLPDGGFVSAVYNGVTYTFQVSYRMGSDSGPIHDLVLCLLTPGGADGSFSSVLTQQITTMAVQPDGKIVVFRNASGDGFLERLNADGTRDLSWSKPIYTNRMVPGIIIQSDGKIVAATSSAVAAGNQVLRYNSNGTSDAAYSVSANGKIWCVASDFYGRILIGGEFTTVNGVARNRLARLNTNGTLDTNFNPNIDGTVYSLALASPNAIVIGGEFTMANSVSRTRIAYLNPVTGGTLTLSTTPSANAPVKCIMVQADGKVLIAGPFTSVSGVTRYGLARLTTGGVLDASFGAFVTGGGEIKSMALQANGQILIAGSFSLVYPGSFSGKIARLNADGTVDFGFYRTQGQVNISGIALQPDGKILVVGDFTSLGGRSGIYNTGRLFNDPATESLSISSFQPQINWIRGGSAPETQWATMEFSTNNGVTWNVLGEAMRVAGGWRISGPGLPPSGIIRALGRGIGGQGNSSSSVLETKLNFPPPPSFPHLVVEYPAGTVVPDGGAAVDLGTVRIGHPETRTFILRNTGTATLQNISASGLTLGEATLAPGQSTTMTLTLVTHAWDTLGPNMGTISISSSDPDGWYHVNFQVTLIDSLRGWRERYFGIPENIGSGANDAAPQGDGITNLMKFASGQYPWTYGMMPGVLDGGPSGLTFTYPRSKAAMSDGIVFAVEWSDTLAADSWSSTGVTEEVLNEEGDLQDVCATIPSGSGDKRFVRLRVIAPAE